MYRQISHTADLAYEIEFESLEELFGDIINILKENSEYELGDVHRELSYDLKGDLEDFVFDTTNDLISEVERGWFPTSVVFDGRSLKVVLRKIEKLVKFDVKALTYHMLSVEEMENGKKRVKVVFDV